MNADYVSRALCFHGKPMQKIWEDERGAGDLVALGIPAEGNYSVYQERQKFFTFQDRAKRLKLHQFIARKSSDLYDAADMKCGPAPKSAKDSAAKAKDIAAVLPPFECMLNKKVDKASRWRYALEAIKPGDVIYGVVVKPTTLSAAPMIIKPLCTREPLVRYLSDVPIKAYVYANKMGVTPVDKRGNSRGYLVNDYICCEVLEVSVDADRICLGLEGNLAKDVQLGLKTAEDLPMYYRKTLTNDFDNYEESMNNSKEILNPNYDVLFELNGLDPSDNFTMMSSLKCQFPTQEYAKELRQTQASKWAFRSVAEGIERFKLGHHVEAFQCLNKALSIDPHNVEGLVARGALYANKGSFVKAVEDFEKALKLNSYHVNARKYMGETLVALGRSYEDENRIPEAAKAYRDCLNIIANHEQARLSLEAIQNRTGSYFFDTFPAEEGGGPPGVGRIEVAPSRSGMLNPSKASSSSATSPKGNNTLHAGPENGSADAHHSKRRHASLSPLSKRMALHDASLKAANSGGPSQAGAATSFNQPYYATVPEKSRPIDFKVNQLDDDDMESRVRRLLSEASKHKKEKTRKSRKDDERSTNGLYDNESASPPSKGGSSKQADEEGHANRGFPRFGPGTTAAGPVVPPAPTISFRLGNPPPPPIPVGSVAPTPTRLSFPLKKPVKIDKFGLVRIATPLGLNSPSPTRSLSRSASRSRSRSRSRRSRPRLRSSPSPGSGRRRGSYRRSSSSDRGRRRSRSRPRYRGRQRYRSSRSRSYSRSRSRSRSRSPRRRGGRSTHGGSGGRRRTPSPFVPRDVSPSYRRRRSKSVEYSRGGRRGSRSPRDRRAPSGSAGCPKFRNRVWQRPGYSQAAAAPGGDNGRRSSSRDNNDERRKSRDKYEDPSIEEIDELINKAQRERIEEIIKRDKEIVKKAPA